MAFTTSLVSAWELNEASGNALDSWGSNALTDNGSVGSGTGLVYGTVRDLESGTTHFFSRADNAGLSVGDIDFSFEAWVKFESLPGGNYPSILNKWAYGTNDREYALEVNDGTSKFRFNVSADGTTAVSVDSTLTPTTATWYQVICWHDSVANQIGISVNNQAVPNTTSHAGGVRDGTSQFRLGQLATNDNLSLFDGLMGPVRFWKKVLSTSERTQLYNSGNGLKLALFDLAAPVSVFRPAARARAFNY